MAAVRECTRGTDWNVCVAVVQDRVVQGMVDLERHATDSGEVQQFMQADARTFRPYAEPETILDAMQKSDLETMLVTTSAGQLLGALRREDLANVVESANDQDQ
ncbi:MAG: CBS domain-containing protein [Nitrolancea sp.]